jgi:hypothetical protein
MTVTASSSVPVLKAGSIADAFAAAVAFIATWSAQPKPYIWFRGVRDCGFGLRPGAIWRSNYDELEPLLTFTQEGSPFARIGSLDEWETYYFAQHHGMPTRLLDWTLSFGAALFFAFDNWDEATTPCVWIMQPYLFNQACIKWDGTISPENNPEVNIWLPRQMKIHQAQTDRDGVEYDNENPIAIYPRKNGGRLHAQQGAFTVHGRTRRDLVDLVKSTGYDVSRVFARLELKGFTRANAFAQLATLGIRRSTVYPDIDNFVRELQEYYCW